MTKIKICGITCVGDALAAAEAGADAVGFVFVPEAAKRNRYITPEAAAKIAAELPPFVVTVGVIVNEPLERARELLAVVDRLQLHGDESPAYCAALGPRAYKAVGVTAENAAAVVAACATGTVLLDTPARGGQRGGTGECWDWTAAVAAMGAGKKIILAGGLAPENVEEAVHRVRPWAVDVSSGVEESPGKKNHERIYAFIHNTRKASLA